jgi:hypothetical protein
LPFELTATGLTIQSLAEIKGEMEDAFRVAFGQNIVVDPDSVFGQIIGPLAEREALVQQLALSIYNNFNANNAVGVNQDALAALTATFRKDATKSLSAAGKIVGTPATAVTNGSQVRLLQTNDLWVVTGGPYVIPGGGSLSGVSIEANEAGPKVFQTTSPVDVDPDGWSIETPIAGWDTFETESDIDPEDTGRDDEVDEDLRERREDELLVNGNDIAAIKANVLKVEGVLNTAKVVDNVDCTAVVDGIPGGAFEVILDGGADADIAQAIFDRRPPGAESFGTILTVLPDGEGGTVTIGHTRPTDVDQFVVITMDTTGAEGVFPTNGLQLAIDAFLAEADKNHVGIGQDVVPPSFHGTIFDAVKDQNSGLDSITSVVVAIGIAPAPVLEDPVPITIRERADWDTARTSSVVI